MGLLILIALAFAAADVTSGNFGVALGLVRSPDAPIFGIDVSLQKARTSAFFSGSRVAAELGAVTTAIGNPDANVRDFVSLLTSFFGPANGAFDGRFAVSNRAVGLVARPYFPDGEVAQSPGPLSRPINFFSPFSVCCGWELAYTISALWHSIFYRFEKGFFQQQKNIKSPIPILLTKYFLFIGIIPH